MELICFLTKSTHDQRHLKPCHHRLDNIKLDPCWKDFSFSESPGAKHTKGRGKSGCGKCPKAGLEIISKRAAPSAPSNPCCAALWPEATQKPHRDIRGSLEILRSSGRSQVRTRLIPHLAGVLCFTQDTQKAGDWAVHRAELATFKRNLPAAVFVWATVLEKKTT